MIMAASLAAVITSNSNSVQIPIDASTTEGNDDKSVTPVMNENSHLRHDRAVVKSTASNDDDDENVIYSVSQSGSLNHINESEGLPLPDNLNSSQEMPWSEKDLFAKRSDVVHPTSNLDVFMHIFKSNVGTGILAMPNATKNAGLTAGMIGVVMVSVVCIHCMHLVVKCSRHLCLRVKTGSLDYPATTQYSFATGPHFLRRFSGIARIVTIVFLCVTQLGFCCVYFVFVSKNIREIVDRNFPHGPHLDYRVYMTIILVPIILINLLRNLKFLSPASTIANVLQVVSLGITFYYICQGLPPSSSRPQFASFHTLPLWFGTVIFAFEGIALTLPLENSMKKPQDFLGLTGVLNTSMIIVTTLCFAVGFYGFLKYGDKVLGSITLNLPNEISADIVRALYSIAMLLTYAIQFFVPAQLMWATIEKKLAIHHLYLCEVIFRIFLVLITFALASAIPQLGLFISLVGSLSACYLTIILPPMLDLVTYWNDGISWPVIVKDIMIILLGILGCLTGSYVSIEQIIETSTD